MMQDWEDKDRGKRGPDYVGIVVCLLGVVLYYVLPYWGSIQKIWNAVK